MIVSELSGLVDDCLNELWSNRSQHSIEELAFSLVSSSPIIWHMSEKGVDPASLRPHRLDTNFLPVWYMKSWNVLPFDYALLVS